MKKNFICILLTASILLLSFTSVYAENITADDIISAFDKPSDERLEFLLNLTDENGVKVSEFSDPELITRIYQIKNEDLTSDLSMFSKYNGDFSAEFDTTVESWQIPVIKDGEIVKIYDYTYKQSNIDTSLKNVDIAEVKDGIGFGMIYPPERLTQIINDNNIGTPIDIKSSYTVYPLKTIFVYVKTKTDEYVIPCFDVKASLYNENDEYTQQLVFEKSKAYNADKFVEMYKKAEQDKIRWAEENNENRVIPDDTYAVGDDGEVIVVATKTPVKTSEPIIIPTEKPTPTATPKPEQTVKPTIIPTATTTVLPTDIPQDKITVSTDNGITVTYNDVPIKFTDAFPFVDENNRTMLPLRAVSETLGYDVEWDYNTSKASIIYTSINGTKMKIIFKVGVTGGQVVRYSGDNAITSVLMCDTRPIMINNRVYVPLRALFEKMEKVVTWNDDTKTVVIADIVPEIY